MRIPRSAFVTPGQNTAYGIFAVAVSVFVFAYSTRLGAVTVLLFYALWFPLILIDYRHVIGNYARFWWILCFALFACLSFFWSAAPGVSLRGGIQYATTIICALIASRVIDSRTLVIGSCIGTAIVLLYSLAFGSFFYDPIDGSYSFVGAFSSKNQLGFYASLGLYFTFASFFILQTGFLWRAVAAAIAMLSAYSLIASSSATSVIATAATLCGVIGISLILKFSPGHRRTFFWTGLIVAGVLGFTALNAGAIDLVLGAFGKDSTLTGRTYLWEEGIRAGKEFPIAGMGYQAYWVQGFSEAERLWDEFYIGSRNGFHFHNTYIEVFAELGYVGLALVVLLIFRVVFGNLQRLLHHADDPQAHLMFGVALMLLIRSFFEIDFMQPYTIGSFLLYYSAGLIAIPQGERKITSVSTGQAGMAPQGT
ncbi:MAG: O-antigen ligase family protein [Phyllobacterium sp.]